MKVAEPLTDIMILVAGMLALLLFMSTLSYVEEHKELHIVVDSQKHPDK